MRCDRCGKENPADIHTCTPLQDLNYSQMKDAWCDHRELIKYHFILDAWVGQDGQVEYGLLHDRATTERVL